MVACVPVSLKLLMDNLLRKFSLGLPSKTAPPLRLYTFKVSWARTTISFPWISSRNRNLFCCFYLGQFYSYLLIFIYRGIFLSMWIYLIVLWYLFFFYYIALTYVIKVYESLLFKIWISIEHLYHNCYIMGINVIESCINLELLLDRLSPAARCVRTVTHRAVEECDKPL